MVTAVSQMCLIIDVLSPWCASNRLFLKPSKSQFIWLSGCRRLEAIDLLELSWLFPHLTFSLTVHDVGITLYSELKFSQHVNLLAWNCYYQLCQLQVVSRSLAHDAIVVLVQAFVTSHIDHCCCLLVGLPLGV